MSAYRRNLMVGITVLIAGLLFIWMMLNFSSRTAELFGPSQIPIQFTSPRADGLSQGSAVYFLGVNAGRVTNVVRRDDGQGVDIGATIDSKPPIPDNVHAEISQSSAIGGGSSVNLEIDPAKPSGGPLQPHAVIQAVYLGLQLHVLPPEFTQTAQDIGDMSVEIKKTAQQLRESGAIGHLNDALTEITTQTTTAGRILQTLGNDQTREDMRTAIANIRQTSEATTRISAKIDVLTDTLRTDSDQLNKQVADRLTQISAVLNNLQDVTAKIQSGKGTAGLLVNDPRLYEALVTTTQQLSATASDLHRLVDQWEQEGVSLKLK
jgi:phospholipid/cholesterol/gamma-HCH transport system substrate-binding protein